MTPHTPVPTHITSAAKQVHIPMARSRAPVAEFLKAELCFHCLSIFPVFRSYIYNYLPKYWLSEPTKNICRSNQLKQSLEAYRSNKHHHTNQQTTEQQRGPPQKNKEENKQTTIIVPNTQEMMLPARINIFYFKATTKMPGERKGYAQNLKDQ